MKSFFKERSYDMVKMFLNQFATAIFGFVLLLCYNGTRGKQNKYFFYLFYPMHLLFLVLLRMALPFVH